MLTTRAERLATIVGGSGYILLDFDGPVCSVFANHPAKAVAADLHELLAQHGARPPASVWAPGSVWTPADPLEVLRYTATLGRPALTSAVEDALRKAECVAARSATPTRYARKVMMAANESGRRIGIVSNNSEEAISAYLVKHDLAGRVHTVVGRPHSDPGRMKPHPAPLLLALRRLGAVPEQAFLVGDSVSDIEASDAAGLAVIGYANKPGKSTRLASADVVITSMGELAMVLRSSSAQLRRGSRWSPSRRGC